MNVYSVPTAGGEAAPLTKSDTATTTSVSYFPSDDRFLFTRDQGGNELNHLFVQTPAGEEKDLTPGEKLKAAFKKWTRDGRAFYVRSNERDARFFDVYRYDAASYARTLFYQDDVGYDLGDISDDAKWIAFQKINTTADSDIYLWSAAAKTMTLISKHTGTASYEPASFDVDSKWLYYLTQAKATGPSSRGSAVTSSRPASPRTSRRPTGTSRGRSSRRTASTASRR